MLRKLTKLLTNNFGLKILSAVFAIILWLVVVNVEDPDKTAVFSIPVDIVNAEYLTEIGKTYEVLDNTDMVTFSVTGKRSVVEQLKASDFSAVANMEFLDDSMSMIPITVTPTNYSNQLEITKRSSYVLLNVENLVSEEYTVNVVTEGSLSSYCYVDSTSSSVKKVFVSGPESVVSQIDTAQVTVDVTGASEDVSVSQQIILFDEEGMEIPQDRLTLDETYTTVSVKIKMAKDVPVEFIILGEPAAGYRSNGVKGGISSVKLAGDPEVLGTLNKLEISGPQLNISGATSSVSATIHLADYLPDGVVLASGESEDVTVNIEIEAQTSRDVEMPVANITVSGLADNLWLSFNSETIMVHITGYKDELDSVNGQRLTGTLDASGIQNAGTYTLPVVLNGQFAGVLSASAEVTVSDGEMSGTNGSNAADNSDLED